MAIMVSRGFALVNSAFKAFSFIQILVIHFGFFVSFMTATLAKLIYPPNHGQFKPAP